MNPSMQQSPRDSHGSLATPIQQLEAASHTRKLNVASSPPVKRIHARLVSALPHSISSSSSLPDLIDRLIFLTQVGADCLLFNVLRVMLKGVSLHPIELHQTISTQMHVSPHEITQMNQNKPKFGRLSRSLDLDIGQLA